MINKITQTMMDAIGVLGTLLILLAVIFLVLFVARGVHWIAVAPW